MMNCIAIDCPCLSIICLFCLLTHDVCVFSVQEGFCKFFRSSTDVNQDSSMKTALFAAAGVGLAGLTFLLVRWSSGLRFILISCYITAELGSGWLRNLTSLLIFDSSSPTEWRSGFSLVFVFSETWVNIYKSCTLFLHTSVLFTYHFVSLLF